MKTQLTNYRRLIGVLIVSALALVLQFVLGLPQYAQITISILGSLIALLMFIDMVQTLRSGKFGVDLLAITAVIATIVVGEYWAAMIVLLMLTGGDALEDYAANKANSELKSLIENSPTAAHLRYPPPEGEGKACSVSSPASAGRQIHIFSAEADTVRKNIRGKTGKTGTPRRTPEAAQAASVRRRFPSSSKIQ